MKKRHLTVFPFFAFVFTFINLATTDAADNKVTLQNFVTSDEDVVDSGLSNFVSVKSRLPE